MTTSNREISYRYLRESIGLVERRDRRYLELSGPDSVEWLQRMVTNDVAALAPGEGCYACLLDEKGKLVVDLQILRLDNEKDAITRAVFVMAVEGELGAEALEALDRFLIMEDAELSWADSPPETLGVHGPKAAEVLTELTGLPLTTHPLKRYHHRTARPSGFDAPLRIVGSEDFGETGFELICDAQALPALRAALEDAGAQPVSDAAANTARIEAFVPKLGVELTRDTIPFNVGIDHAVHLEKGCYRGQETIARFDARGRSKHCMVGLVFDPATPPLPPAGAALRREGEGGKSVGELRSSAWSPATEKAIGIGHLLSVDGNVGNTLRVVWDGGECGAEVVPTPFYSSTR